MPKRGSTQDAAFSAWTKGDPESPLQQAGILLFKPWKGLGVLDLRFRGLGVLGLGIRV